MNPPKPVKLRPGAVIAYVPPEDEAIRRPIGILSATEGFIRAYLQHAGASEIRCFSDSRAGIERFGQFVARQGVKDIRVDGLLPIEMGEIAATGTLYWPAPDFAHIAWSRRRFDQRSFSVCGVHHTLSEAVAMQSIGQLLLAPVQAWDALVCTSTVARNAVVRILEEYGLYLERLTGGKAPVRPQLPIIPLGVDCAAFVPAGGADVSRAHERSRLGIGEDDFATLYFGRLSHFQKANPLPMYLASQEAKRRTGRRVHLLQVGWFHSETVEKAFRDAASELAPDVVHQFLDGREPVNERAWYAADCFMSLPDSFQDASA